MKATGNRAFTILSNNLRWHPGERPVSAGVKTWHNLAWWRSRGGILNFAAETNKMLSGSETVSPRCAASWSNVFGAGLISIIIIIIKKLSTVCEKFLRFTCSTGTTPADLLAMRMAAIYISRIPNHSATRNGYLGTMLKKLDLKTLTDFCFRNNRVFFFVKLKNIS